MHTSKLLKIATYEAMKAGAAREGTGEDAMAVFKEHTSALGIEKASLRIDLDRFNKARTGDFLVLEGVAPVSENRPPAPFNINMSEFLTGGVIQYRKEGL